MRAWRSRRALGRYVGAPLAGLLALLLLATTGLAGWGLYQLSSPRSIPLPNLTADRSPTGLARGQHLAGVVCESCHTARGQPPFSGGANLADDAGLPIGNVYPRNLTPAGRVANYTDPEVARAVRWAVGKGERLIIMPVNGIRHLSDQDLAAIIGHLRSLSPIDRHPPDNYPSPLLGLLVGLGIYNLDLPPLSEPVTAPPKAVTAAYGGYLATIGDCRICHGQQLDGQVSPPTPPSPPLRYAGKWTAEQFIAAMRTGKRPGGAELRPPMPWPTVGKFDDVELAALHAYLTALP